MPRAATTHARIGLGQGVALYVSAILGAGVLTLPGQAASLAGPASLVAWTFSGLLGVPLALTFAALATRLPGAGGVSTFAERAFGARAGGIVGWWYFVAGSVGQTIVPLTGGDYLAQALGLGPAWGYAFAGAILTAATAANLGGLRLSGRVQVVLALAVGIVLAVTAAAALPSGRLSALHPFAPHGVAGVGHAVVILFFAFAGWEAVLHLSGEFSDVRRDLRRATLITSGIVSALYLAIAAAVVLTGTYGDPRTDRLAIGVLLGHALGVGASAAAGVAALVISLGTTNAFVASVSRLGFALGHGGWMPRALGAIDRRGSPGASIAVVAGIGGIGLLLAWLAHWGIQTIVAVPSSLVIATYVAGMAAGVRLLEGRARAAAAVACALVLCVVPFAVKDALVPVAVAALALGYRRARAVMRTPPPAPPG